MECDPWQTARKEPKFSSEQLVRNRSLQNMRLEAYSSLFYPCLFLAVGLLNTVSQRVGCHVHTNIDNL